MGQLLYLSIGYIRRADHRGVYLKEYKNPSQIRNSAMMLYNFNLYKTWQCETVQLLADRPEPPWLTRSVLLNTKN